MMSVDKLRTLPRHGTNGFGAVVTVGEETVEAIADEIEAEAEEMQAFCERVEKAAIARKELEVFGTAYMPLPLDAEGVPVRVGDKLEYCGLTFDAFSVAEDVVFRERDFKDGRYIVEAYDYSDVRHVKSRTLEDVLLELGDRVCNSGHQWGLDAADVVPEYAAKIREFLEVGK